MCTFKDIAVLVKGIQGALARCQDWPSTVDVSPVLRHTQAFCPITSLGL